MNILNVFLIIRVFSLFFLHITQTEDKKTGEAVSNRFLSLLSGPQNILFFLKSILCYSQQKRVSNSKIYKKKENILTVIENIYFLKNNLFVLNHHLQLCSLITVSFFQLHCFLSFLCTFLLPTLSSVSPPTPFNSYPQTLKAKIYFLKKKKKKPSQFGGKKGEKSKFD